MTVISSVLAFAADPFIGTWKPIHTDTWRINPGVRDPQMLKSSSQKWEAIGIDQYRTTLLTPDGKVVERDGQPVRMEVSFDGKEHKPPSGNTQMLQRIDETHLASNVKGPKGGYVDEWAVSADGKTLTVTRKGTSPAKGGPMDEIQIYERQ